VIKNLKPGNVYLAADGSVKLFDYVTAPKFSDAFNKCKSIFVSDPYYLAPEIIKGSPKSHPIYSSDIWSLGITCYELCHGSLPYRKFSPTKALFEIVNKPSPTLPKDSPHQIRHFVHRCLVKNINERAGMDELLCTEFILNAKSKGLLTELLFKNNDSLSISREDSERYTILNQYSKFDSST
jgi:serine/threonine protein kinase